MEKNTPTKGQVLSFFHDFHRNCRNSYALNESEGQKATVSLEINANLSIQGVVAFCPQRAMLLTSKQTAHRGKVL